ncbi:hypothetical protein Tco_1009898 [Tanacetum coccineum]
METHKLHASGSDEGVGSLPKVPDEQEHKTTGIDEKTGTKPGVPGVPKYLSKSENESWGNSSDDDEDNDDGSDKVTKDDDDNDDEDSDADGDNEASDSDKTNSIKDESPNLNQNDDEEEDVRTPDIFKFNDDDEEYKELYKDVNVRLTDTEHEEQGKEDEEITDDGCDDDTQQTKYEQVKEDEHVRHEEPSTQTPPLLNIPITVISETSIAVRSTIPSTIPPITPLQQQPTPTPTLAPTTATTTTLVPDLLDFSSLTRLEDSIKKSFRSYTAEFEKKAKDERKRYIDLGEKSVKDIIKDKSTINESLENVVLAKYSSQPQSTYEVAASLTEFELKKILLDKLEKSKSYRAAEQHRDLYDALVKSYQLDKDLFDSYAGSDQRLKKEKTSKDAEPSRGSKSKESKLSSSKGTKSQPKSSGKSAQADELVFEATDTEMPLNQGDYVVGKPPITFDELMSTPIDFSSHVLNNLKIEIPTQEHLVGPAFNLLKGTCKSRVDLKYHFEECYKDVNDRLNWTNPEGHEYPFDLSKPLPLIEDHGSQVVPTNYFINNNLEYLKGESLSRKYTTFTTKTKAAKYDTIEGIEDMGPKRQHLYGYVSNRKSKHDVFSIKRIIAITHVKVMKKYDYGYLEEIFVRREDQQVYKLIEGDFPRLNLRDIKYMILLLVQKKLSNWERDDLYDLNVALQMFTRRVVILKRVKDLQLGVESYQKKLNITKPETFQFDIYCRTLYTAYQGFIYLDKFQRNRLMHSDELYKFGD